MEDLNLLLELKKVIAIFSDRQWTNATSSNFSVKGRNIWITRSGIDKGSCKISDFLCVGPKGYEGAKYKPSDESEIHYLIYNSFQSTNCILHAHTQNATYLSQKFKEQGKLFFKGYEILKAFPGINTHEIEIEIPIFDNSQDITSFCQQHKEEIASLKYPAFLMAGHGLYAWGDSILNARRSFEACEDLFQLFLRDLK